MDVVIIQRIREDLYAGIGHQQTDGSVPVPELIFPTRKIIRYAFNYAQTTTGKTTCFTKDNIYENDGRTVSGF